MILQQKNTQISYPDSLLVCDGKIDPLLLEQTEYAVLSVEAGFHYSPDVPIIFLSNLFLFVCSCSHVCVSLSVRHCQPFGFNLSNIYHLNIYITHNNTIQHIKYSLVSDSLPFTLIWFILCFVENNCTTSQGK